MTEDLEKQAAWGAWTALVVVAGFFALSIINGAIGNRFLAIAPAAVSFIVIVLVNDLNQPDGARAKTLEHVIVTVLVGIALGAIGTASLTTSIFGDPYVTLLVVVWLGRGLVHLLLSLAYSASATQAVQQGSRSQLAGRPA